MRVFTFYSESHKRMLDKWFLATVPDDVHVELLQIPQECASGRFGSDGWMSSMERKVDYVIHCLKTETEIFVHSDCDLQFFRPFKDDLLNIMAHNKLDLLAQHNGGGTVCCGFMAMRPSDRMVALFEAVKRRMRRKKEHDQLCLNRLLTSWAHEIAFDVLDERHYSVWHSIGHVWNGVDAITTIPENIVLHHANWLKGVDRKLKCLEMVRNVFDSRQRAPGRGVAAGV